MDSVLQLNSASCFFTNAGTVAIFNVSLENVQGLNRLFHHVMHKLNIDRHCNQPMEFDINESTLCFCPRKDATICDQFNQRLTSFPLDSFLANVSLKFAGVKFLQDDNNNFIVKPLVYLDHVQIL